MTCSLALAVFGDRLLHDDRRLAISALRIDALISEEPRPPACVYQRENGLILPIKIGLLLVNL